MFNPCPTYHPHFLFTPAHQTSPRSSSKSILHDENKVRTTSKYHFCTLDKAASQNITVPPRFPPRKLDTSYVITEQRVRGWTQRKKRQKGKYSSLPAYTLHRPPGNLLLALHVRFSTGTTRARVSPSPQNILPPRIRHVYHEKGSISPYLCVARYLLA